MQIGLATTTRADAGLSWPREVDMILSAMEAGRFSDPNRRREARQPYRCRATLKLYADRSDAEPRTLYTRDVDAHGLGFITPDVLPLGYGGWVTLLAPNGDEIRVECTIYRCRKAIQGWHEGALKFNREVWQLG